MGDNRYNSADSRYHVNDPGKGFVPIRQRGRPRVRDQLADQSVDLARQLSRRVPWCGGRPEVMPADPTLRFERSLFRERRRVDHRLRRGRARSAGRPGRGGHGRDRPEREADAERAARLQAAARAAPRALAPSVARWVLYSAVGLASADEIDSLGLMPVPRARRAARARKPRGAGCRRSRQHARARRQLRLPEPRTRRDPRGCRDQDQGRPGLRVGGRGIRHREGAPRPADDRTRRRDARLRLGVEQGVLRAVRTSPPSTCSARATITGSPGSRSGDVAARTASSEPA